MIGDIYCRPRVLQFLPVRIDKFGSHDSSDNGTDHLTTKITDPDSQGTEGKSQDHQRHT